MPDAERWTAIRRLLADARDQPDEERAAWLEAATDEADLRAEVMALLRAEAAAETDGFLEEAAAGRASALFADTADPYVGRRIGPWRLEERLGEGGMGIVYRAERAEADFEQQAALKLVGRGLAPRALVERFRQERRILARLDHPGIARLLDGGLTQDGQPYFAMELVEGEPLTAHADRHDLSVRERLRLFLDVCAAVAYAHRNLVVHRDLKPSNILVSGGKDGPATVRLLDFGIAKVLEVEDDVLLTRTGALMTPAYAAPEQVRSGSDGVTTATDVYALGVVLYELLAGRRPYAVEPGAAPTTVERIVCETEPPPPSGVAEPARARRLKGNLDTIVLKALEKDPGRRYASVEAFADDLQRHLADLPVTARRPTVGYRMRTFVRRHPVGVGLSSLAVLALLLGMAGTTWQARVADAERDRAQTEADRARVTLDFLVSLFEASDPAVANGVEVTAGELLERGTRQAAFLHDQPVVQAELLTVIGNVYTSLGAYDEARPLLERAFVLSDSVHGAGSPEAIKARAALADLEFSTGDYEASERLYRSILRQAEAALAPEDTVVAAIQNNLAQTLVKLGRFEEAERMLGDALTTRRAVLGPAHPGVASALANFGALYLTKSEHARAEPYYREALGIAQQHYGDDHIETAKRFHDMAAVLTPLGRYAEADSLLAVAIAIERRVLPEGHPTLAAALGQHGELKQSMGDYAAALPLLREGLRMREERLEPAHSAVIINRINLAAALQETGRYEEAEAQLQRGFQDSRAAFGEAHPYTLAVGNHLALLYKRQGAFDRAEPLYRDVLATRLATMGPDNHETGVSRYNLAMLLMEKGSYEESAVLFGQAMASMRASVGDEHHYVPMVIAGQAELYVAQHRYLEAEALFRQALGQQREVLPEHHPRIGRSLLHLGRVLARTGRTRDAEALLIEAIEIFEVAYPPRHRYRGEAEAALGLLYAAEGRTRDARVRLSMAHPILVERYGADAPRAQEAQAALDALG